MPRPAKAANHDNLPPGRPRPAGHGCGPAGGARLAYGLGYVLATMPGSAVRPAWLGSVLSRG